MEIIARIGIVLFGIGSLTAWAGWLPVLVLAGTDAAIVTALVGVVILFIGATIWFFCVP